MDIHCCLGGLSFGIQTPGSSTSSTGAGGESGTTAVDEVYEIDR